MVIYFQITGKRLTLWVLGKINIMCIDFFVAHFFIYYKIAWEVITFNAIMLI